MATVIVAAALGVILITGGLFLRRLLGELAELRRQITGIDRQMRAQRAHVTFLRQLLTEDEDDGDDGQPGEAAVVNGGLEPPGPPPPSHGPEPVRRKRHLGLYIGGAVAALATISTAARGAVRDHRGQLIGAVTGAAVTATTVTMVTVQPGTSDHDQSWPPSAPTASDPPTSAPSGPVPPRPTGSPPASAASPSPTPSGTASSSPTAEGAPSASPHRSFPAPLVPIRGDMPIPETSPASPDDSSGGATPSEDTGSGPPVAPPSPSGTPPAESPSPDDPAEPCLELGMLSLLRRPCLLS